MALATFGAGCFWGVQALFSKLPGVISATAGYMGGETPDPTYEEVCTDTTGHAEVVQVAYYEGQIRYDRLLDLFFENHDPTTLNRQGVDVGTQYRSVIFTHNAKQREVATAKIAALTNARRFSRPIVTQVVDAGAFTAAEEYHQNYYEKRGISPTCHL